MNKSHTELALSASDTVVDIARRVRKLGPSVREVRLALGDNRVLRNYFNIRLLQALCPDKFFFFIVADLGEPKVGESLWIRYYLRSDAIDFEREFSQTHILRHNFSFFEYFVYEARKLLSRIAFHYRRRAPRFRNSRWFSDSSVVLLFAGLIVSVGLLSFIFYFAVSKTYVYISPELSVRTASRNLYYSERTVSTGSSIFSRPEEITVRAVQSTYSHEYVFRTTAYDQASAQNAWGRVVIKNELTTKQTFRPKTRLMTENGLVYRTDGWVEIPAARVSGGTVIAGSKEVRVTADMYDRAGAITGVRGNIEAGTILTIPGLTFNRDKIYAEVTEGFTGGADPTVHVLTTEELARFRAMAADKLRLGAYEQLRAELVQWNKERAEDYAILPTNDVISYSGESAETVGGAKAGDKIEEVRIVGSASVRAYAYDASATRAYLHSILQEMLLFGTEKLIAFNDDSIRISNVVSRTESPFSMKATTELDATISYDFEDDSNTLTKKLKDLIVNTSFEDARSIMLNNTNIANVRIVSSPFWLSRVVGNPDNIEFIINH